MHKLYFLLLLSFHRQVALIVKSLTANSGDIRDMSLIPGLERSPGGGHGNPPQYSWMENPMDIGAWWATVHGVTKSQVRPREWYYRFHTLRIRLRHMPVNRRVWWRPESGFPVSVKGGAALLSGCWLLLIYQEGSKHKEGILLRCNTVFATTVSKKGREVRYRLQGFLSNSVQFSHSVMSDSLRPHGPQHARPPCPSPTPGVYLNSCPLSQWCHPNISSSLVPSSSCL